MHSGGIFDSESDDAKRVFLYAVENVNNDLDLELEARPVDVKYGNEFETSQKLCRLLRVSIQVLIVIVIDSF